MIQLIASDMDGTLLNDSQTISQENIDAIRLANEHGITFMVATGRGYTEAKPALEKANIVCPMITVNGAQIYDETGTLLFTSSIDDVTASEISQELNKSGLYYEIATTKGIFSINQTKRIENVANFIASNKPSISYKMAIALSAAHLDLLSIQYVDSLESIIQDPEINILKFIVFSPDGPESFTTIRSTIQSMDDIFITSSHPNNIEINHSNAQKGAALAYIANHFSIPIENTMTFGDNFNDMSMLKAAGVGVAMGNAEPEVKAVADITTDTNVNNGVAHTILSLLEDKELHE